MFVLAFLSVCVLMDIAVFSTNTKISMMMFLSLDEN